jgi:hypothetical protein
MKSILAYALRPVVPLMAVATTVAFAAPAAADGGEYLRAVQDRFVFLSAEQLLSEGQRICASTTGGMNSADAVIMTSDDLEVSVPAAFEIVNAAIVHLC